MKDLIDEYLFHKNEEIEIVLKLVRLNNKYKQVLDKIKEYSERNEIEKPRNDFENGINIVATKVLKILEEIE